ncbi:cob(I)yrinic acid a,c-diamide adenosyltransferase [candidate division LCP-89 bacterium B3_LCP]|uniref:corrinoid adenosyltransferase n=1 Tax=candidate division LCP-89 bacterium B3_LCP TaxID=2012998 RepID=A0A532UVS8_UNCL8|nr:MAG: cob(I)yrinic acid a,c-diamide adenosyltransferase [candidate division LCP-89 bacterium B3_LCP]
MKKTDKGFVQIYTGDGKGKTTAALGLALRAAGAGLQVRIVQFMKGQSYSELEALKRFEDLIQIFQTGGLKCIRKEEVTEIDRREAARGLDLAHKFLKDDSVDILILDEILVAHWFELVDLGAILEIIELRPDSMELVLTGRKAPSELIEKADLVSEIKEVKHYYQQGVPARKGIES